MPYKEHPLLALKLNVLHVKIQIIEKNECTNNNKLLFMVTVNHIPDHYYYFCNNFFQIMYRNLFFTNEINRL